MASGEPDSESFPGNLFCLVVAGVSRLVEGRISGGGGGVPIERQASRSEVAVGGVRIIMILCNAPVVDDASVWVLCRNWP